MQKLRAALALLVLFLFPIVVLALVVGLFSAVVLAAMQSHALGRGLAQLLLIPLVIGIIAAIREARRAKPQPAQGPELTRPGNPELWATVDQLAALARTAPPERIVVVHEVNAAVHQVGRQRELLLGLPILAGLTVGELRSVLAHELGHFAGGDTELSARTLRARSFLVAVRDNAGALIRWFFALYYLVFVRVSAASSRDVELRADRFSAEAAGPVVAASALHRIHGVAMAWDYVLENRVPMFEPAGARAPLHEAVVRTLHVHREAIERATEQELRDERPRWDATHPKTADRIGAFERMPVNATAHDDRPAMALLGGAGRQLADLEGDLLTHDWPLVGWNEVADRGVRSALPERMDRLILALQQEGAIAAATPSVLLRALREDPAAIGRRLVDDPDQALEAAQEAAVVVTQGVLARVPGVRAVFDEQDEVALVDAHGEVIETRKLAAEAATELLPQQLTAVGAVLDVPVDPAAVPLREPESVVLGALTMTIVKKPRRQMRDLLVCSDGLLFVPLRQSYWAKLGGAATKHNQRQRIEDLARRLPELRADPTNEWIPVDSIRMAQFRIVPPRLTINRVAGDPIVLSFADAFEEIPLLTEHSLGVLLGDRMVRGKQAARRLEHAG